MNANTLTKSNAKSKKSERQEPLSLADLDDFVEAPTPQPEPKSVGEIDSHNIATKSKGRTMEPLTISYIEAGVNSLTRAPSPNLKNENFRADLLHWGMITKQALTLAPTPSAALIAVVQHVGSTEGTLMALRIIRSVMGQVLWQASVDIYKDRHPKPSQPKPMSENELVYAKLDSLLNVPRDMQLNETDDEAPAGLDPTRDQDYVAPPTEAEAFDALVEANAWLGSIATLLIEDANEAEFFGLTDGLEYTQRKVTEPWGDEYIPIHSAEEAVELQLLKNEESFAKRAARRIEARKDSFAALARLCAA